VTRRRLFAEGHFRLQCEPDGAVEATLEPPRQAAEDTDGHWSPDVSASRPKSTLNAS
jgi:hypothetical protein